MCDWMATCGELREPIVGAMIRRVPASKVIGTDDTPVKVRGHAGKGSKTGRLWAYLGDRDRPIGVPTGRSGSSRAIARVISSPTPTPALTASIFSCARCWWYRSWRRKSIEIFSVGPVGSRRCRISRQGYGRRGLSTTLRSRPRIVYRLDLCSIFMWYYHRIYE